MVLVAPRMAASWAGKVCSPLRRSSTELPPTIGAEAYASSVGKKDGSPSASWGSDTWGWTRAQAARSATTTTQVGSRVRRIKRAIYARGAPDPSAPDDELHVPPAP